MLSMMSTLIATGSCRMFVAAICRVKLNHFTDAASALALFAPTDAAFVQLTALNPDQAHSDLLTLRRVLSSHVVHGQWTISRMVRQHQLVTVCGMPLEISHRNGMLVNKARLLKPDLRATNGIIHLIDGLILPVELMSQAQL